MGGTMKPSKEPEPGTWRARDPRPSGAQASDGASPSRVGVQRGGRDAGGFLEKREDGPLGSVLYAHDVCESTQAEAKAAAKRGAPHGTLVVARRQRHGFGRHGRDWFSGEGGLYFSLVLRPSGLSLAHLSRIPLLAGAGLLEGTRSLGAQTWIRWPNDILVNWPSAGPLGAYRKVGGCLVEALLTGAQLDAVVLGVGLNVQRPPGDYPAELQPIAACLADVDVQVRPEQALGPVLDGLERWLAQPSNDERFFRALDQIRDGAVTLGRPIEVWQAGHLYAGCAEGLDADGALLLRRGDGDLLRITSGDIRPG